MKNNIMKNFKAVILLLPLLLVFTASQAQAMVVDAASIFSNLGFENGNLSGWTVTQPNSTYVVALVPAVNPTIDPSDPANNPTTLTAPVGSFFTGLKRPGDSGDDLKYKLAHDAVPISFPTGTSFQIIVYANKGRLEPFDTPASTARAFVKIFGWSSGSLPTVTAATDSWSRSISWNPSTQEVDFTGVNDGDWVAQLFTFNPTDNGFDAGDLAYLTVSLIGQTHNHDQYIALDTGVIPEPSTMLLFATGSIFGFFRRRFT